MKLRSVVMVIPLVVSVFNPSYAHAADQTWAIPELVSFEFSPKEIELTRADRTITVNLKVSHPIGIKSEKINIYLKNAVNPQSLSYQFTALRSQNLTQNGLSTAVFTSTLILPDSISSGVWNFSSDPIQGLAPSKSVGWPESGTFTPINFREMLGAENSLLIRLDSELKYDFQTFVGPAFRSEASASDGKPFELNVDAPIWKIGETIELSRYFQMRAKNVSLELMSKTPLICQATGTALKLLSLGECNYRIFTSKTRDYLYKELNLFSNVTQARTKPDLSIPKVANQSSDGLPKPIILMPVYSYGNTISPKTLTPGVCIPTNTGVTLYAGGICELQYSTEATLTYLASDIYIQRFEVIRNAQTITFNPPSNSSISGKTIALSATTSSGGTVVFTTTSAGVCSISGSILNLLKAGTCSVTATQAGTSTLAPVSATANIMLTGTTVAPKKTITCAKGKTIKKVTGTNPKCPTGYKLKK